MTGTTNIHWKWAVLPWLIGGFVLFYGLAFLIATMRGEGKFYEACSIVTAVKAEHLIPPSISTPGKPAVFCDLGVKLPFLYRYDRILVYGVANASEQDSIVATVKRVHDESHTRKVLVQFYEKENWKTWSDRSTGNHGGERGPENPTRRVWVN
jgi:hypothetical protein